MASNSKTLTTSRGGQYTLSVNWNESSTNIANNTSVISASGSIGSSSWAWDSNYNSYVKLYWHDNRNNTDVHFATSSAFKSCGVGYGGTRSVSGSITVTHNDNGALSGYVICKFEAGSDSGGYSPLSNNVSTGWTALTTIPRASSFGTVSGDIIGENITVNINRHSSSFTHQLWYRLGNSQWYDCGSGITTSKVIKPTLELCRQIPSSNGGTLELSIRTFNGSTRVGSDVYKNIYVKVPDSVKPSAPSISLTRIDNGVPSSFGVYVQGYSKVKATATASGSYGSTITSCTITCDGASGASGTTFGPFSHGTKTITATATDSRGRSTSSTVPIQVYPYSPPAVSVSGVRCNADKTLNPAGTSILVTCNWSITSVNNKNTVVSQKVSITPGTATKTIFSNGASFVLDANLSPSSIGVLTATITDTMGNSVTATYNIPTDIRIMNIKANKKGIAFGKFAKEDNVVDFGWEMKLKNGKYLDTEINRAVAANASTTNTDNKYWKIKINSKEAWMLCFTVRVYQSYTYTDIVISGYNYPAIDNWHAPRATLLGTSSYHSVPKVIFGHDGVDELWVAITGGNYTGINVFNVTNGYMNTMSYDNLFTITHETTLTGTTQQEIRPIYDFDTAYFNQIYVNNIPQFEDTGWIDLLPNNGSALLKYRKKNGFVTIVGESWGGVSIPTGSWTTIATLPANCKPAIQIIGIGTLKATSGYEMEFNINTNGAVTVYNLHPNTATTYWAFTVTYPV